MNDYWNNPPDNNQPDPPDCPGTGCKGTGEYKETIGNDMVFECDNCHYRFNVTIPQDPGPEPEPMEKIWDDASERMIAFGPKCPHGNEWFSCDACDHASDIAYDAAREKRMK